MSDELTNVVMAGWELQMLAYFSMLCTQLWERQATVGLLLRSLLVRCVNPGAFTAFPLWCAQKAAGFMRRNVKGAKSVADVLWRGLASLLPPDEHLEDDPYWRQVRRKSSFEDRPAVLRGSTGLAVIWPLAQRVASPTTSCCNAASHTPFEDRPTGPSGGAFQAVGARERATSALEE